MVQISRDIWFPALPLTFEFTSYFVFNEMLWKAKLKVSLFCFRIKFILRWCGSSWNKNQSQTMRGAIFHLRRAQTDYQRLDEKWFFSHLISESAPLAGYCSAVGREILKKAAESISLRPSAQTQKCRTAAYADEMLLPCTYSACTFYWKERRGVHGKRQSRWKILQETQIVYL